VRAVHIGVVMIISSCSALFREKSFVTHAGPDRGDHRANFFVGQDLGQTRFFDIDDFAAEREDRLETAVAALFRAAAGGIAFDDIEFGAVWIAVRTVGKFTRQRGESSAPLRRVSSRRFAGGFARLGLQ